MSTTTFRSFNRKGARNIVYFLGIFILVIGAISIIDIFLHDLDVWHGQAMFQSNLIIGFIIGLILGLFIEKGWPQKDFPEIDAIKEMVDESKR